MYKAKTHPVYRICSWKVNRHLRGVTVACFLKLQVYSTDSNPGWKLTTSRLHKRINASAIKIKV